ncbi:ribonucleases P/MRP protein subunit POP1-domain-containing protein [Boletus reticuloceps]|uniref:Ribonucleases P/MRP protein subunit POP1-domain-containing protein n=1 Tax=Boletus reticuloceps TaxID=495285 RepID=A0A8I2YUA3_9AGAM|nr:ribonucleases P/MRP protein subunit POP1-domain-containing protein [Boletus reticuloceps]
MPPKRKNDDAGESSARERKKLKVADARTIQVQGTSAAGGSNTTNDQRNAVASSSSAGPSKTAIQFNSMQGLPASLDVERFTEARAYEIDAMQKAIKNASKSSTHRAWQTLPRHLRRRAASHDVRRVPVRLRDKARAEMDANKRRLLGRPKRGRANQTTRTEALLKRQRDKSWLETHIWHAKRAKMQNMWGYRLAVTPTEKAFRPSHRASMHGSILHDASYYATIELKGPQWLLQAVLEQCCDPQVSGMKRYMTDGRACEARVYKHASYPLALLGPITIIWQPLSPESNPSQTQEPPAQSGKGRGKGKGKGKEKQTDDSKLPESNNGPRVIWVRCHPAIFEDVFESVRTSASYVLEQSKKKDPQKHAEIEIADLRGCINAFEIMGPKSSQVIKGALSPVGNDDRKDAKKFWDSLTDLQTSSSIPRGMVVGLQVLDPRLKFPPKNAKPHYPDVAQSSTQMSPAFIFPTALTAQSELWDEEKRGSLKSPGTRRRISTKGDPSSTSQSGNTQGVHGWTLLFPAGWGMAFLSSLLYTGTRFAGQRERMKQFFEAGVGGFPNDYPSVAAYDAVTNDRAEQEKARWERTPPAKKPNYEKLGTRSPWSADWGVVLGLEKPNAAQTAGSGRQEVEELVTTQRENPPDPEAMRIDEESSNVRPWLLRGPRVPTMLSNTFITSAQFLGEINKLRVKNHMTPLDASLSADDLMRSALVMVRAKMVRRGAPTDMANIYKMEDPEARKWIKAFEKETQGTAEWADSSKPNDYELGEIKPAQTDIIGYVTTGDVSLLRGEGFAIGAIPVMQYFALRKQALRLSQPSVLVKIRDRDGTTCRVAYLELLDS